jgi:carboxypeptidase Taq
MPRSGSEARADHKATVRRLAHETLTQKEMGELLERLSSWEKDQPYDSDQASIVRVARREYEQAVKVPPRLVAELSRAGSEGYHSWLGAREANDFTRFIPALQKIYRLCRELAETLGYEEHALDALLDQSEPGMKVTEVEAVLEELKRVIVPLVDAISRKKDAVADEVLHQPFDEAKQWALGLQGVNAIGFNLKEGRTDRSVHPFSTTFSPRDVRITSRVFPDSFNPCFFGFLHEAGHGNYMQGIPVTYRRTPLARGASSGTHESQSRTWENLVGRSRGFWEVFFPKVQDAFPDQTKGTTPEDWYCAVNKVEPSFIRVEADEVTYNLHIIVRFELEKAVYDGDLKIEDLRAAWNEKFRKYLGIVPPSDLVGVLQDIHWSGFFGASFVSYTLGNVMSVQFYEAALRERPGLREDFARGDYSGLLDWTRRNIHAHGSKYRPGELTKVATGQPLSTRPYLGYIRRKFSDIYGL